MFFCFIFIRLDLGRPRATRHDQPGSPVWSPAFTQFFISAPVLRSLAGVLPKRVFSMRSIRRAGHGFSVEPQRGMCWRELFHTYPAPNYQLRLARNSGSRFKVPVAKSKILHVFVRQQRGGSEFVVTKACASASRLKPWQLAASAKLSFHEVLPGAGDLFWPLDCRLGRAMRSIPPPGVRNGECAARFCWWCIARARGTGRRPIAVPYTPRLACGVRF